MLLDYPLIHSLLQTDCSCMLCCCTSLLNLRIVIRMFHVAAAASLSADILIADILTTLCCCTTFLNLNVHHCVQCLSCASVMRLMLCQHGACCTVSCNSQGPFRQLWMLGIQCYFCATCCCAHPWYMLYLLFIWILGKLSWYPLPMFSDVLLLQCGITIR